MERIPKIVRTLSFTLLPAAICLLVVAVLAAQFKELGDNQEILPASSFIVLITLGGLSFNWCRVSTSFAPEDLLKKIYAAGIDFFCAALLALISTALAFVTIVLPSLPTFLYYAVFILHWLFLLLSLLLFALATLSLLSTAKQSLDSETNLN